jgi:hypothetical protein
MIGEMAKRQARMRTLETLFTPTENLWLSTLCSPLSTDLK